MRKGIWSGDKYTTVKSCAAVALLGTVAAALFLIIRVVGEKRLECLLNFVFGLRRKETKPDLTAEIVVADNRS